MFRFNNRAVSRAANLELRNLAFTNDAITKGLYNSHLDMLPRVFETHITRIRNIAAMLYVAGIPKNTADFTLVILCKELPGIEAYIPELQELL